MARPIDIVRTLCPRARPSYLSAFESGDALFAKHAITTPLRLAHFLAQAFHETGGLTVEWESGNYSAERLLVIFGEGHHSARVTPGEARQLAYDGPAIFERVYGLGNPKKAKELGNTQPGDGFKYRGGGILQTTGRANYRRMGEKCGVDFESHPEFVLVAEHALKPALAEWTEGNLNAAADRDDIRAITRRINGGYNGLDDRAAWLRKIKPLCPTVDLIAQSKPTPAALPPVKPPVAVKEAGAVFAGASAGAVAAQAGLPWWQALAVVAVVGMIAYFVIHTSAKRTGSMWGKVKAWFRNSVTILWARVVACAGLLLMAGETMLQDPNIAAAIQSALQPKFVPYYVIAIGLITELARRRTVDR